MAWRMGEGAGDVGMNPIRIAGVQEGFAPNASERRQQDDVHDEAEVVFPQAGEKVGLERGNSAA